MLNLLLKPQKLEKLYLILVALVSLVVSLATINQGPRLESSLSLLGTNPQLLSVLIAIISGIILLISSTLYLLESKIKLSVSLLNKIMTTLKVVMAFIAFLLFLDIILLGIARAYLDGSSAEKFPSESGFLVKLMYLAIRYSNLILTGIQSTLLLSLLGTIIGLIIAIFMVIVRTQVIDIRDHEITQFSKKIGLALVKTYVTVIRGTPMIVQAMIFFYLMRQVFFSLGFSINQVNQFWTPFVAGLFTVSVNTTAYLIEVLRGGIMGVDKGQIEAGRSLGFSSFKTYLLITFPQALRNSMPAIGNEFIVNIKDTAVLTLIQVVDLFAVTRTIAGNHYSHVEAFIIAAIIYLVLTYGTSKILMSLEKRLDLQTKEMVSSN
jgi:ABC-type amino acid transport system permease subunit